MAKKCESYYTRDSLKNFHIKVQLQKLTSSRNMGDLGQSLLRTSTPHPGGQEREVEAWVFRWQQKVFSQHEEELYADKNNCINTVEEQYHREVLELRNKGGRQNKRLFSYVDKDSYKNPVTLSSSPLTDSEVQTFASKHGSTLRRRHVPRTNRGLSSTVIHNPISHKPSDNERLLHRIILPPSQSMFLMADLSRQDGLDTADEYVLCHITVDAHGMVTIDPDFNVGKPAYRIENRHREVFEYRLEHSSQPISSEDRIKEKRILSELYNQHVNSLNLCVGNSFMEPPETDSLRLVMMGEIVSAQGFEYDDLYVTAHLECPDLWEIEDEDYSISPRSQLPAVVTQICSTRSTHKFDIAHFACPFEFSLVHHYPTTSKDSLPKWPRILLEVASLDYWDRHRVEGYGYVDIPSQPGSFDLRVPTWRPTGRRVVDRLKRFFTGGPPEIDDITYVGTPKDFQGTHLSRYGFRTETSGSVLLHFNLAHQSNLLIKTVKQQAKYKDFKGVIAAVLESYQRAKDRALAVTSTMKLKEDNINL